MGKGQKEAQQSEEEQSEDVSSPLARQYRPTVAVKKRPMDSDSDSIASADQTDHTQTKVKFADQELDESRNSIGGNSLAISYRPTVFVKPKNLDQLEISNDKEDITAHQATKVKFLDAVD